MGYIYFLKLYCVGLLKSTRLACPLFLTFNIEFLINFYWFFFLILSFSNMLILNWYLFFYHIIKLKKNIIKLIWVYNPNHEFDELTNANINWSNISLSQYLSKKDVMFNFFLKAVFFIDYTSCFWTRMLDYLFLLFITGFFIWYFFWTCHVRIYSKSIHIINLNLRLSKVSSE